MEYIDSIIVIAQKLEGLSWPVLGVVTLIVVGKYAGPVFVEHARETLRRKREGKTINGKHEQQLAEIKEKLNTSTNHQYHEVLQVLERIDSHVLAGNKLLEGAVQQQGEMYTYLSRSLEFLKARSLTRGDT